MAGGHCNLHQRHCHASARQTAETCACRRNLSRVPILLVTKNSRTFQDPGSIFPRPCLKPAMLKFLTAVSNHIYNMIAAFILEYMFITVTCCEKIAKKLFEHFLWNRGERTHIFWRLRPHHVIRHLHHCLANSTTFQVLEILQTQLHDWNPVLI